MKLQGQIGVMPTSIMPNATFFGPQSFKLMIGYYEDLQLHIKTSNCHSNKTLIAENIRYLF
jgi:hypothetical protein